MKEGAPRKSDKRVKCSSCDSPLACGGGSPRVKRMGMPLRAREQQKQRSGLAEQKQLQRNQDNVCCSNKIPFGAIKDCNLSRC